MAQAGSRDDGFLGAEGRRGAGVAGVGAENVVENVEDPVGEEDVLLQDASRVDEKRVGREGDGDHAALPGSQRGPIEETVTVVDLTGATDDVVAEQVRQLRHGQVGEGGTEVLEGEVIRREDGDVLLRVDVRRQRGIGDRTARRGEIERRARTRKVRGWDEKRVDGVDDPAVKGDVLGLENGRG